MSSEIHALIVVVLKGLDGLTEKITERVMGIQPVYLVGKKHDDKIYMSNLLQDKGWKTKVVER